MWLKKNKELKIQEYINEEITIMQIKHESDDCNCYTLYINIITGICLNIKLNKKKAYIVVKNKVGFWQVYNKVYINTKSTLKIVKTNAFSK